MMANPKDQADREEMIRLFQSLPHKEQSAALDFLRARLALHEQKDAA